MTNADLTILFFLSVTLGWFFGIGTSLLVDKLVASELPKMRKEDLWHVGGEYNGFDHTMTTTHVIRAEDLEKGSFVIHLGDAPYTFDWDFMAHEEEE